MEIKSIKIKKRYVATYIDSYGEKIVSVTKTAPVYKENAQYATVSSATEVTFTLAEYRDNYPEAERQKIEDRGYTIHVSSDDVAWVFNLSGEYFPLRVENGSRINYVGPGKYSVVLLNLDDSEPLETLPSQMFRAQAKLEIAKNNKVLYDTLFAEQLKDALKQRGLAVTEGRKKNTLDVSFVDRDTFVTFLTTQVTAMINEELVALGHKPVAKPKSSKSYMVQRTEYSKPYGLIDLTALIRAIQDEGE